MSQHRWLRAAALLLTLTAALIFTLPLGGGEPPVVINNTAVPRVPTLDAGRVARGAELYAQNCAQCHGAQLEGAADWKRPLPDGSLPPPPHDDSGHTWHHPDGLLLGIIADGGDPSDGSKMPRFGERLSPEEMRSILEFIKSSWGTENREFQWWITATTDGR